MRFSTFRQTYRLASQQFGPNYRRAYRSYSNIAAVLPTLMRTNPFTLRLESLDSSSILSVASLTSSLQNLSVNSSSSDLASLETSSVSEWLLNLMEEYQLRTFNVPASLSI